MSDRPSSKLILYRQPSPKLGQGLVTHIADARAEYNHNRALDQWNAYLRAFTQHGWQTLEVDPAPDLPDSVFVEDTVVVFEPRGSDDVLVVLTNPGAVERNSEVEGTAATIVYAISGASRCSRSKLLAHSTAATCSRPIMIGSYIVAREGGQMQRAFGSSDILRPYGYVVKAIPMTKALHLKSAATALPDGTVLLYKSLIDDVTVFPSYLEVPEEHGVAVVALDDHSVIMPSAAPRTAEMIRQRGYNVVALDITELERLEGCVTCLSVRFRRQPKAVQQPSLAVQ